MRRDGGPVVFPVPPSCRRVPPRVLGIPREGSGCTPAPPSPAPGVPRLPRGAGKVRLQTAPRPLRQLLQRPAPRGGHGPGTQRHPQGHLGPDHRHGEPRALLPAAAPARPLEPARVRPQSSPGGLESAQSPLQTAPSPPKPARPPRIQLSSAGHPERPPGWGPRGGGGPGVHPPRPPSPPGRTRGTRSSPATCGSARPGWTRTSPGTRTSTAASTASASPAATSGGRTSSSTTSALCPAPRPGPAGAGGLQGCGQPRAGSRRVLEGEMQGGEGRGCWQRPGVPGAGPSRRGQPGDVAPRAPLPAQRR